MGDELFLQARKTRKVISVMGWELRRQLREPAGGCDCSIGNGIFLSLSCVRRSKCRMRFGFATGRRFVELGCLPSQP